MRKLTLLAIAAMFTVPAQQHVKAQAQLSTTLSVGTMPANPDKVTMSAGWLLKDDKGNVIVKVPKFNARNKPTGGKATAHIRGKYSIDRQNKVITLRPSSLAPKIENAAEWIEVTPKTNPIKVVNNRRGARITVVQTGAGGVITVAIDTGGHYQIQGTGCTIDVSNNSGPFTYSFSGSGDIFYTGGFKGTGSMNGNWNMHRR